jgi:hypothetical protein
VTSLFTTTSFKVGVLIAVSVESVKAETVVTFFVIVGNTGSQSVTGVSSIVASLTNDTLVTFVLFAIESTVGVNTGFVVGTVMSVSYTFVQISTVFTITNVSTTTGALECKLATAEGTDGIAVTVVSSS